MSSSWSEIRSRANNDPLLDTISDLQAKANQSEAIKDITTTDKIPPIRIIRSKVEIHDKGMMTGYVRPRNANQAYFMGQEPDGDHLRLQVKFDSACDSLNDYSMQGNIIDIGYQDTLPVLLKATEDDGITAGDMVSVVDGATQYYRIPVTDAISIKKMVLDGKPGITIIYRHFPLFINNESNSANTQRATPVYMIENDQVEYAVKWEVDDLGHIYFFFRHQFINYYVRTVNPMITPPPVPDYYAPDYSPLDFDSAQQYYDIPFPTPYVDLAMEFNFTTKAISMYVNAVLTPTTTTAVALVPPLPAPIFPPAFSDPPPPPEQPEPFFQPFQVIYNQLNETSSQKVNAITTTQQNAFYNVPGTPPTTDPIERLVTVEPPPESLYPDATGTGTGTVDWTNVNNYVLLAQVLSTTDSGVSLSNTTNISTATKIDSATVGQGSALIGRVINRISFWRKQVNDPTGTLNAKIWDAAGNVIYTFDASMAINIATNTGADPVSGYSIGNFSSPITNTHAMAVGDKIGFEYTPTNAGHLFIQSTATDIEPALSVTTRAVGAAQTSWTADTTRDMACKLWRKKTDIELAGGVDPGGGTGGGSQTVPVVIPAVTNPKMKFRGGFTFTNHPKIHFIFAGSNWNTRTTPFSKTQAATKFTNLFESTYFEGLLQYGVKRPVLGSIATNTTYTLSNGYTKPDILSFIQDSITQGIVPGLINGVEQVYVVIEPYGITDNLLPGSEFPVVGYHTNFYVNGSTATNPTTDGWIVVGTEVNSSMVSTLDDLTIILSEEIVESITNPYADNAQYAGWTSDTAPPGFPAYERLLCDWCSNYTKVVINGVMCQPYWSNQNNDCIAPIGIPSFISCPTGYTYDIVNQWCVSTGTGGGGGGGTGHTPTLIGEIPSNDNSGAIMEESDNDAIALMITDVSSGLGQKLNGKIIHSARFTMLPLNNPTGRMFCKIWDENDNEVGKIATDPNGADVSTFEGFDADGDGWIDYTFVGENNTVVMREGYKIGVEYKTDDSSDGIRVRRTSDIDDSVCQASRKAGETDFNTNESYDTKCMFWELAVTQAPAPLPAPLDPIPQAAGDGGAADQFGVKATYSSATGSAINYNWIENFQGDSYRFDWESLSGFAPSCEMIGYFKFTSSPPDDEVAGKMGGGQHSDGSRPRCYVMGVGITDGASRYRVEDWHPTTNGGSSGGTGKSVGSNYVGYKYVKWNKGTTSVLLEIWQDQGNNDGSTPANQWVRLASWNVTSPLWLIPPSDRQETLRIDGVSNNLEWKWLSLRPIGENDTGTGTGGGTGGGGTGGGTTGTSQGNYDTWGSSSPLCNNISSNYICTQTFAAGVDFIGSIPSQVEFAVWRNDAATSGTYHIRQYDSLGNVKKTFSSAAVVTLPSIIPSFMNVVWQDVLNDTPLLDNDMIGIEVEGVINTARVYVMNNKVARGNVTGQTTIPITTTTPTIPNSPPILANPPSNYMKLYHPTGCTLSGAVVHLIFWGNDWKTRVSPFSKDDLTAAIDQFFQSRFNDGLIQYGIKRPRRGVSVISTAHPDFDNYSQQDLADIVAKSIIAGIVPKQTADNKQCYLVIPNKNIDVNNDPGFLNVGGYHTALYFPSDIQSTFRPGEQVYIPWGFTRWWPWDNTFVTLTHEIIEIITDPYPIWERLGVYITASSQSLFNSGIQTAGEVADVCPLGITFNGNWTASWWSNQDNGCIGNNNAPTWISCPTGKTWDPAIQECRGNINIPNNTTTGGEPAGIHVPATMTTPSTSINALVHQGGPVYSAPAIYIIFEGSFWNTATSPFTMQQLKDSISIIRASRYFDYLLQYGIKKPRLWAYVVNNTFNMPNTFDEYDINDMIQDSVNRGLVPNHTPTTQKNIYVCVPNPAKHIAGQSTISGINFLFWDDGNNISGTARIEIGIEVGTMVDTTDTITHEICEQMTNPIDVPGQEGWKLNRALVPFTNYEGDEISDPGETAWVTVNGVYVSPIWSNKDGNIVPPPEVPTWLSCPANYTFDNGTQDCVSLGTAATSTTTTTNVPIGGLYDNDFDDTRSCLVTKATGQTVFTANDRRVDMVMSMRRGGSEFLGYIELNHLRKRVGAKANQDGSLLEGKIMSKTEIIMKRVGVTPIIGKVECNIRNSQGNLMQAMGSVDASIVALTDTPLAFINTQHSYTMTVGDIVSIEVTGGSTFDPIVPDQPVIVPNQPSTQGMVYQGGPVYSTPNVYIIFDTATWNTLTIPFSKTAYMTACDTVFNSTYFDALLQYGIRKPKTHTYIVNTTLPLPSTYTITNVKATIENSKTLGQVPSHLPTSQHNIYIVMAAPGKTFTPPSGFAGALAYNASYWTDSTNTTTIIDTATVYAVITFQPNDTLSRITRSTFHEMVELMASPINNNSTSVSPNAWKVNTAVLGTANGVQICDPGEGLNPILGTTGGGIISTGGGGGTGTGTGGGSVDQFGVKASYATGQIKYDWIENFRPDGKRFDFEGLGSTFPSCELIGYFADNNNPNDEVSGKMGGGGHSDGSRPRVYDMGIDTVSGATRYRTEDWHPDYTGGQSGPDGEGLKSTYTGYKFIKWNRGQSVKLEIWQDTGNNEGATPANQWTRVATWNVTDPLWLIPPSDHQETIRIDSDNGVPTLRWKWLSLREIRTTDTESGTGTGGGGGTTEVGVTVAAYYSNLDTKVVPPPTAPTWISCGTGGIYNPSTQTCSITSSGGASSVNSPVTSTNYLMVRVSNGFFNAADASKTMLFESMATNINFQSTLFNRDLAGVMYTGGRQDLLARPMRGVKVATLASVLYDKVITEVRLKLKGTGILPLGNLLRVKIIRGVDKVTVATIGALDINSISTTQFIEYYFQNPDNKYRMKVGDLVALEFNHGNSDFNFLEVKTLTPQIIDVSHPQPEIPTYDGTNTIMFEYTGTSWIDLPGRDISGSMSIGGYTVEPDPVVIPPQPPFHYAHEWFISASAPEDSNAMTQPAELLPKPNSHYNNIAKEFRVYDFLLTPLQLENYYQNRFTITPVSRGHIEVVGHDSTGFSTS